MPNHMFIPPLFEKEGGGFFNKSPLFKGGSYFSEILRGDDGYFAFSQGSDWK